MMKSKKPIFFFLIFITLPVFSRMKMPEDFSWLLEFMPLTESVTVDHWEKDTRITFDENGWVQVDKKSNPVTLSQYALVCFDTYRTTGDTRYKKAFLNQVKYLMSEKQYKVLAKDRVGYPYNYSFHDLKPDWYSGLAQAEAICVLIRYYSITKDKEVLPLIIKLKNHMIWPMEDGGLLAKTPEGGIWIEEYPNSKQNKHVLNGFLISIFGLYEYTKLFPDDNQAKKIYEECLLSLKKSVGNYDTGKWLQYDRGNKSGVSNWYMKAQVIEMKLIYAITNDMFFYRLHQLWTTYAYNKPLTFIGCMINDKNFSVPVKASVDGWLSPSVEYANVVKAQDIKQYVNGSIFTNHGSILMLDKSISTYFQPLWNDTVKSEPFSEMIFKSVFKFDRLSFNVLKDTAVNFSISFEYKRDSTDRWREVNISKPIMQDKEIYYLFNQIEAQSIRINFKLKKNAVLMIAEMNLQNSKKTNEATYAFFQTDAIQVGKQTLKFNMDLRNANDFVVFFKYGKSKTDLLKAKWDPNEFFTSVPFESEACASFYQFLVVYKIGSEKSAIKNIKTS